MSPGFRHRRCSRRARGTSSGREGPPRDWYIVVLGSIPTVHAYREIDARLGSEAEEDALDRKQGHVLAAVTVLDATGCLVPDTTVIADSDRELGRVLLGRGTADLHKWINVEPEITEDVTKRLDELKSAMVRVPGWVIAQRQGKNPPNEGEALLEDVDKFRPTRQDLAAISDRLRADLDVPKELWRSLPLILRVRRKNAPEGEILSSMYLPDLAAARQEVVGGTTDSALASSRDPAAAIAMGPLRR